MTPETEHLMKALWLVIRVCVIVVDVGGVWVFRGNFTAPAKTPRDQLHTIPARLDSGELNTR